MIVVIATTGADVPDSAETRRGSVVAVHRRGHDIHVVAQRQIPIVLTVQTAIEIPQLRISAPARFHRWNSVTLVTSCCLVSQSFQVVVKLRRISRTQ